MVLEGDPFGVDQLRVVISRSLLWYRVWRSGTVGMTDVTAALRDHDAGRWPTPYLRGAGAPPASWRNGRNTVGVEPTSRRILAHRAAPRDGITAAAGRPARHRPGDRAVAAGPPSSRRGPPAPRAPADTLRRTSDADPPAQPTVVVRPLSDPRRPSGPRHRMDRRSAAAPSPTGRWRPVTPRR